MDKIQLLFFFLSGFLVSRLIIKVRLPERIVFLLVGQSHTPISIIFLYLVAVSAFLSFFIPNAITVLTMLPIVELLRRQFITITERKKGISTMLALSIIYGANIGGMGSITATPANGILITFLEVNDVRGTEHVSFASWLYWAIPLVLCFIVMSWLIMLAIFRPWRYTNNQSIILPLDASSVYHPLQFHALVVVAVFFVSSLILSIFMMYYIEHVVVILVVTAIFTSIFIFFLFFVPFKINESDTFKVRLLTFSDCYSNLPARGFFFAGLAVLIGAVVYLLKLNVIFSKWISSMLPTDVSVYSLFLIVAVITTLSTELLSNTVVQISMFVILLPLSYMVDFPVLNALIIVTLSSTCAFMSPVATGVNGLAFGGVKGVSLVRMLVIGFVMNIAGAVLISFWASYVISYFYKIRIPM
jgi:sodium-dependent dicarboxylate transporter 2/3/5